MNTPKTMLLGWGSLIAAAGVSYYYARKSINQRRAAQEALGQRPSEKLDWRSRIEQEEKEKVGLVSSAQHSSSSATTPNSATTTAVDARNADSQKPS
ncbi:hypothetical protein C8Q77DRAFT_1131784 [Trametes polyzona]|nr:hypothetical protein C8Q77DRAFT_1131784 [Trametes polyzona]